MEEPDGKGGGAGQGSEGAGWEGGRHGTIYIHNALSRQGGWRGLESCSVLSRDDLVHIATGRAGRGKGLGGTVGGRGGRKGRTLGSNLLCFQTTIYKNKILPFL